ncbi:glycosyltransferase [Desulfobaculum sp. SPO524]|uniref:glycosyltransferase n=1 Tax=Desulfobaculum sp. SPO524 TaxID=3378071 RepID=UPI0038519A9A
MEQVVEHSDQPVVTAIVSAYKCERFIRGCLDDLLAQSLGERLEIIVVETGSPENERDIVREYQQEHETIRLITTDERETIYSAWNRGARAARGRYLTNANADDRHRHDALEVMAATLDANPQVALVYANAYVTATPCQDFATCTPIGRSDWPAFDRRTLFTYNFVGPQPMWRAALHERYGYFDRDFEAIGDYEFWLRIARTEDFLLIPDVLGLYFMAPETAERRDPQRSRQERLLARRRYRIGE